MIPLDTSNPNMSKRDRKEAARRFQEKMLDVENFALYKKFALIGGNLFTPSFLLTQAAVLCHDFKTIRDKQDAKSEHYKNWLAKSQQEQTVKSFFKNVVLPELNGQAGPAQEPTSTTMLDKLSKF